MRLMIVDDTADFVWQAKYIAKELSSELGVEMTFSEAFNGIQAIEMLTEMLRDGTLPDLMLLDLMMPRMGGHGVLNYMQGSPTLSKIPVVVVTAFRREGRSAELLGLRVVQKEAFRIPMVKELIQQYAPELQGK